ncbi:MAG: heme biosynthesis protein HemY [Proteobacteria bacterium]|nr:MAG: heme biosynthesis protein HemY [Pseudomonadota bacterium]QKK10986.1 MAG: heme biosynthesis protein HemY [Pseudomonadota bacterium]
MKLLIGIMVVLLAAAGLSLLLMEDPGYLLVGYGHWTLETSVAVAVIVTVLTFLTLYYALRTLANVRGMPRRFRHWRQIKRGERARRYLSQGLVELAEGNWGAAEKHLLRHVHDSDTKLLNYLGAARAAQQRGDSDQRDVYLQHAHHSMPEADVAVGLTQADLQLAQGQLEQALATATHLKQVAPHHAHVLKLLAKLYRELRDWERLHELLPELRKRKVLDEAQLRRLTREVCSHRLDNAARERDAQRLQAVWKAMPRELHSDVELLLNYVQHLVELGEGLTAERLVAKALGEQWDDRLVALYGQLQGPDAARQLAHAEGWLKAHPQEATLLYTLAQLALRNRLWGKARIYLESSISAGARVEAYSDLGALLEQLGDRDSAMDYYRKGLQLATGSALALPAPAPEHEETEISGGGDSGIAQLEKS